MVEMYKNDVKIDNKMQTKITKDWLAAFPSYKKFRPGSWKKRVGPLDFHMGYDISYGTNVKPGFSIFNLANPLKFMAATLEIIPQSRRYSLTWKQHEEGKYKEAAQELRDLSPIPIEGPVTLSQVINAYKNYKFTGTSVDDRCMEDPALISAWAGKVELAKELADWGKEKYILNTKGNWMDEIEAWYQDLLQKISDPEALRQTVKDQIEFHKLTKVPYEDLIIDL